MNTTKKGTTVRNGGGGVGSIPKPPLQSDKYSSTIPEGSTVSVESILREQLVQWRAVQRQANREIDRIEKRLAEQR